MSDDDELNRHDPEPAPRRAAPPDDETAEQRPSETEAPRTRRAAARRGGARRGGPSRAADDPHHAPSHRTMLIGTIAALVVVTIVGVAAYLINSLQPSGPSATPVATSTWALGLPVQIGDYTRDPNAISSPSTQAGTTTTSATYTRKGQDAVVVLMSRPQTSLKDFMSDAGMTAVTDQPLSDGSGTAQCGIDPDHNDTGCVVLQENTAVLALGLQDQSRQDLADLAQQAARQAAGR